MVPATCVLCSECLTRQKLIHNASNRCVVFVLEEFTEQLFGIKAVGTVFATQKSLHSSLLMWPQLCISQLSCMVDSIQNSIGRHEGSCYT